MILKTKPFAHQMDALNRFLTEPYGALFCEMGTGKTKISLDIMANGPEDGALVAAPNGLHLNWMYSELPTHWPDEMDTAVYCWKGTPTTKKAKLLLADFMDSEARFKFFLINVEALRTKSGFDPAKAFLKSRRSLHMVIDESTCIKNPKAAQTKACFKLGALATRRWLLNGTPITQGPLDLFAQCKFLSPTALPYASYTAFKSKFAVEVSQTFGNRQFNKIVGYRHLEQLSAEVSPFSLRLTKEECLDLPDKVFKTRVIEATPEQSKAYAEMKDLCLTELREGAQVSVTNALTKIIKLHQILTGFVVDDEGTEHMIPNNRIPALVQDAEAAGSMVIFCAYVNNVKAVAAALEEKFPNRVVTYYGDTKPDARTAAVKAFQAGEVDFFVASSAAAKGITLHRTSELTYFSNPRSLETRLQSQDRIHRIGQDKKCTYTDLVIPNSLDEIIINNLKAKKDIADLVLDEIIDIIEES
jgi:SNF2 family DNA or RNA helicase